MKTEHKAIRAMLKKMVIPRAREILIESLPQKEYTAIFYSDVKQEDICYIADIRLQCAESTVKRYKRDGYVKLASLFL